MNKSKFQTPSIKNSPKYQSKRALKQGFTYLITTEKQNFINKELLKRSCHAFAKAIQFDKNNSDAFFGLAYVLTLLKEYTTAYIYILEASKLDPKNQDLHYLKTFIEKTLQLPSESSESLPLTSQEQSESMKMQGLPEDELGEIRTLKRKRTFQNSSEYDELLESLEKIIRKQVHDIMHSKAAQPTPSLNAVQLDKIRAFTKKLQEKYANIDKQLNILDEELETTELRIKLKPIEVGIQRLQETIHVSLDFIKIKSVIEEYLHAVNQSAIVAKRAKSYAEFSLIEKEAEIIIDHCDTIADQLDDIDDKGFHCDQLDKLYENLCIRVEGLQELIDDGYARLENKS